MVFSLLQKMLDSKKFRLDWQGYEQRLAYLKAGLLRSILSMRARGEQTFAKRPFRLPFASLCLCLLAGGLAARAYAQRAAAAENKQAAASISMHFPEMTDIAVIAEQVARALGRNIMLDQQAKGKVKIIAPELLKPEDAYATFLSSLDLLGLTTVDTGKITKIVSLPEGLKNSPPLYPQGQALPDSDVLVTYVLPLKYIEARWAEASLSRFATPRSLMSIETTNTLIISDSASKVAQLLNILALMDVKTKQPQLRLVPVRHSIPGEIVKKLQAILQEERRNTKVAPFHEPLTILPVERQPAIAVFSTPAGMDHTEALIRQLDAPLPSDVSPTSRLHVRPLEYMEAKKIAAILANVATSSRRRSFFSQQQEGVSAHHKLKLTVDEASNSLLIVGSHAAYGAINYVLRRLDVRKPQVLLEVELIELGEQHNLSFGSGGILGYGQGKGGKALATWQAQSLAPLTVRPPQAQAAASSLQTVKAGEALSQDLTIAAMAGKGVEVPGLGRVSPGFFLRLIKADANTRNLSSPYILAVDNEEASLAIGETLYFSSAQEDSQGGLLPQVEKENFDMSLTLKPTISINDQLSLTLKLEANQLAGLSEGGMPRSNKKKLTQVLQLVNGQTVVVSGLKRQAELKAEKRVPFFGELPFVGMLFRNRSVEHQEQQLVVFITPHVVHSSKDLARVYQEKLKASSLWREFQEGGQAKDSFHHAEQGRIDDDPNTLSPEELREEEKQQKLRQEALRAQGYAP